MPYFTDRLKEVVAVDLSTTNWRDALRATVVTGAICLVPVLQGHPEIAVPLSMGAIFTAATEAGQPYGARWRTMLWSTAAMMGATLLGQLVSDSPILAIAVTAPVAFLAGSIGTFGKRSAIGGVLALVLFSIYVGHPAPVVDAPTSALLVGLGGFIQTIAVVADSLLRRRPTSATPAVESTHRNWDPVFLRHGARLAVLMVIATAISEHLSVPHPYWLPVSVAWMSLPDRNGTVTRVFARLTGTIVGLIVVAVLAFVFTPSLLGFLVISLLGAGIKITLIKANYALGVCGATIKIVALLALLGDPIVTTMDMRLLATVAAAFLIVAGFMIPQAVSRQRRGPQSATT